MLGGFRVQGSGCRVQGAGFRVQGAGFRVQGSGFRVGRLDLLVALPAFGAVGVDAVGAI